ncbi:tail protein [Salmonella enterica subsp. enterica]|uniref:Tail protein n=1 Tax=Salmonella enterica I TaxID=59201 RepID=A0A447N608_SALET|nr:tail protein [Salmonella enterica subsp. enterica]
MNKAYWHIRMKLRLRYRSWISHNRIWQHQNALNELKKKTLTLTSQLADEESRVRQQHAMALATMGMGDQQRGRYEERLKIQQHYQEQLEQLKRDSKAKGTYGSDEYRQAEQALKGSLDRRLLSGRITMRKLTLRRETGRWGRRGRWITFWRRAAMWQA